MTDSDLSLPRRKEPGQADIKVHLKVRLSRSKQPEELNLLEQLHGAL